MMNPDHIRSIPEAVDADLAVPVDRIVIVDRDWLVHVDSITSLVAARGLDDESKEDLRQISIKCRRLTGGR